MGGMATLSFSVVERHKLEWGVSVHCIGDPEKEVRCTVLYVVGYTVG